MPSLSKSFKTAKNATSSVARTLTSPSKVMSFTNNKDIMVATGLFWALSPGLLFNMPDNFPLKKDSFFSYHTSPSNVVVHAIMYFILLHLLKCNKVIQMSSSKIMFATVLFITLSPGFLLEVQSNLSVNTQTNHTSNNSILVHTLVFMIVYGSLRNM